MSEIKVNSIKGVAASTAAITVNNSDGTCAANVTNGLSNRRLNINGAMSISQRGTVTGITNNASAYGGPDRYKTTVVNHGTYTSSQEEDAPEGFTHSLKVNTTSAASSPASNARLYVQHKIEKQEFRQLKKGTSNAKKLTVQFFVKGDKTGTYILELFDNINNRHVSATYTISSQATWEKKTITFPADTGGNAYDGSNGDSAGIEFNWWLAAGSAFTSGTLATTWTGNDDPQRVAGITVNVGDSGYWQLTGVQVEISDHATDFEHRLITDELAQCQRYCFVQPQSHQGTTPNNQYVEMYIYHPTIMRAKPTVTQVGALNIGGYDSNESGTYASRFYTNSGTPRLGPGTKYEAEL